MGPTFLWIALGYASCVWDCSSSPLDPRWPSATGIFILLLAMRVPRFSHWGAALCGLVLDAAHGGPLGPRVIAGVLATALTSRLQIGRAETSWVRATLVIAAASTFWLTAPLVPPFLTSGTNPHNWSLAPSLATTILSTTLVVLAMRSVASPQDREE